MFERQYPNGRYEIIANTPGGRRYCFYCELTGTPVYTTGRVSGDTPVEEISLAWKEARSFFSGCSECGRWIRDEAYNIDEMKCIRCAPYKKKPRFCTECGCPLPTGNNFCVRCGHQIEEVIFDVKQPV